MPIDTSTMIAVYTVQLIGSAFLGLLLFVFYRSYGHSYLREWAWSWVMLCIYVGGALAATLGTLDLHPRHPMRLGLTMTTLVAGYTQIAFLLLGTYAVARGRPAPERRRQFFLGGCVLLGLGMALPFTSEPALFDARFFVRVGVRSGAAALAYATAGFWLARHGEWSRGAGRRIVLCSFFLYGLEQANYFASNAMEFAGLRQVGDRLAWFGFVDHLLQVAMGLGMVIWLLEDERNALSRTAEALRRSEERLRRSQRLEQVGQLAGGVAHDFNNLLTVITGRGQRLMERLRRDSEEWREVQQIDQAAARGASLVQQLLAFSRKQVLAPQCVQANWTVRQVQGMLKRLIGEQIKFRCELSEELGWTMVDPVQLEQVLLNLVINARDAMPDGGTLTVSTKNVAVAAEESDSLVGLMPGEHIEITVHDTGLGMDEETQRHAFEPFFTTKGVGDGSGLGMATVYGVVRQSGGSVVIDSSPGKGTAVHVYLPRVAAPKGQIEQRLSGRSPIATGRQSGAADPRPEAADAPTTTVLIVEDDERIRSLLTAVLTDNGYEALVARDGAVALDIARKNGRTIDLLLTDIVMPKIGGPELAEKLLAMNPDLRVVFMTGYAEEVASAKMQPDDRILLEKPFSLPEFLDVVGSSLRR